jgi:hypothetical protein
MSKTTTFDKEKATEIEAAICDAFGCSVSDLIGYHDTTFKKVVVYVLHRFLDYDARSIGRAYQMTYLYVPAVVDEIEFQMLVVSGFRGKIIEVLKNIGYEANLVATVRKVA